MAMSPPAAPPEGPGQEAAPESWWGLAGRVVSELKRTVMGIAPEDFEGWFASRYGEPTPAISKCSFGESCEQAVAEGKLVLIWLHQEESAATEKLCKDVFQSEAFLELLGTAFLLWAGDVSRFEPGQVARILDCSSFPALIVAQPLRSGFDNRGAFALEWPFGNFAQPLLRFSPRELGDRLEDMQADTIMAGLLGVAEDHQDAIHQRRAEEERRSGELAEDRRIREEQDREYQEALLADQLAAIAAQEDEAARQREAQQQAEEAEAQRRAEAEAARRAEADAAAWEARRLARREELLAEPEAQGAVAKISLRLHSGDRLQRSFAADRPVSEVYEWAHCCRPSPVPAEFVLCTSFPVAELADRSATLQEAGLCPSAALLLKAVED